MYIYIMAQARRRHARAHLISRACAVGTNLRRALTHARVNARPRRRGGPQHGAGTHGHAHMRRKQGSGSPLTPPPPACPAPASSSPAGLSAHCSCAPAPAGPRYRCAVGPSAQLHAVAIWFAPPGLVRAQRKPRRPRPCRRSWRVDQSDLGRSRRRRQRGVDEEARHAHAQSQSAHAAGQVRG